MDTTFRKSFCKTTTKYSKIIFTLFPTFSTRFVFKVIVDDFFLDPNANRTMR